MNVTLYLNDGAEIKFHDANFDVEDFEMKWKDINNQGFVICGTFWTRHAIQGVTVGEFKKTYPNREG